jgi:citrate synthase
MNDSRRKTAITWVEDGKIRVRGYRIEDLIGRAGWGEAVFLLLTGELPAPNVGRLMEAILVAVMDHGPRAPSNAAARTVASTGASLNACVAAGVLAISKFHGGAIEECMTVLEDDTPALELVTRYRTEKKLIPGFGHRLHTVDPRTTRLFQLARELGLSKKYIDRVQGIERALGLPANADGAIAALLCGIGFPKQASNGLFMAARLPGLVAHTLEEQARNKPLRSIHVEDFEYDGPGERDI